MKNYLLAILFIAFTIISCRNNPEVQHLAKADYQYYKLDKKVVSEDSLTEDFIKVYRDSLQKEMGIEIGFLEKELIKRKPNSSMGNWFADLLESESKQIFKENKVDFAFQNYGGLRVPSIAAGPITKGDVFELMPFDNNLVLCELDIEKMQLLLNRMADYGGWPVSKSLSFKIQDSIATEILINNKPLEKEGKYYVAMPDYVANGGDDCHFLSGTIVNNSGVFIRDIVINNLKRTAKANKPQIIDGTERIKVKS